MGFAASADEDAVNINRPAHRDLSPGTILRHREGFRIRVTFMKDDFASAHRIRLDGQPDRRHRGWSGRLLIGDWSIVRVLSS